MTDATHNDDTHTNAYGTARARAHEAVDASRERARDAARLTAETIESNPVGVLVGGLALGALVGAIVPRTAREKELLAPAGRRIRAAARASFVAAKDAGRAELDQLGLNKSAARDQAKSVLDGITRAATTAGKAAVEAGSEQARHG